MKITPTPIALPAGSCDSHTHVFLDPHQYPWAADRRYTPPPASIEQLVQLHDALGIERVVIVQPSVYAADNAATLQALRQLGPRRARGVAVIDDAHTDNALDQMHALGIRGVRVNLEIDQASDATAATAQLRATAARVARLGWHVQVYANLPLLAACADVLAALPVPVVLDHYAGAYAAGGIEQPGLSTVLELLAGGNAYVKLSAPYRLSQVPGYADMEPLARQFIATRADRLVWGSDWPHPQPGTQLDPHAISTPFEVDSGAVLTALRAWTDDATFHQILVQNPARLYDFDG